MKYIQYLFDEEALAVLFVQFSVWGLLVVLAITIAFLSKGADWLIDGRRDLARRAKIPKVIVGATILSLGTTAPEMFVSVTAAFMGDPSLALGNGVGSIIADTGLIFGITVLVAVPKFQRWILNRTGWWQIGSALLMVALATAARIKNPDNPVIGRGMGAVLVVCLGIYLWMTLKWSRHRHAFDPKKIMTFCCPCQSYLLHCWGGLTLVIVSSRLLVPAAGEFARRLGVSEDVIAATMVALGTSLPELSTAIAAMRKGQPEITIGNIVGADVLNSLFVVGVASLAHHYLFLLAFSGFTSRPCCSSWFHSGFSAA